MGVPKRRQSKARKNMRRSEWRKMEAPSLVECPKCHDFKMPHRVCLKCGYYDGKEVLSK